MSDKDKIKSEKDKVDSEKEVEKDKTSKKEVETKNSIISHIMKSLKLT